MTGLTVRRDLHPLDFSNSTIVPSGQVANDMSQSSDTLLTFKEAMSYLRISRSTLYRLMWSNQLTGYKVGRAWRFYRNDLQASMRKASTVVPTLLKSDLSSNVGRLENLVAVNT